MKFLKPDLDVGRLGDIDVSDIYDKGIRCIFADLDNTIALWRRPELTGEAAAFVAAAREKGISVVIFTNAKEDRAREAAWEAGLAYYALARKPFPFKYHKAIAELGYRKSEVLAVGDQIFTDVLGGNLAGCTTALTSPLSGNEFAGTKALRFAEKLIAGRKLVYQEGG
ncbi:MAG: YqeG family HAD IIIA-type phosphatase [Clostridiales bacterium]|nr:YqeG family HAD IIIA-type phosphatase [Clostridiales bacterium]